jgi:Winged helix-turn-helix DNA-binding
MADLLDAIQRQLRQRLDELRPLVSEYERLREADRALGASPGADGSVADRERGGSGERSRRARRGTRARTSTAASREANREKILAVVDERPGVTKAELREAAGLSSAGLGQNLRRLVASGRVREEALPGEQIGYRLAQDGGTASQSDIAPPA